jgi:hypothetical protein
MMNDEKSANDECTKGDGNGSTRISGFVIPSSFAIRASSFITYVL